MPGTCSEHSETITTLTDMASYVLANGKDGRIVLSKRSREAGEAVASTDVQDRKRTKPDIGAADCSVRVDDPTTKYEVPKVARCSAAPSPGKVDAPSAPSGEPGKENFPLAVEPRAAKEPSSAPVKFARTVVNHLSRPVHIPKPREIIPYRIKTPDCATVNPWLMVKRATSATSP